jgi:predicted permease
VVGQAALAFVLLAATGLLLASLARLLRQDPGFEPRGVLAAETMLLTPRYDEVTPSVAFVDEVLRRARALPGVQSAGAVQMLPVEGEVDTYGFHVEDVVLANEGLAPEVTLFRAAPGTDATLRLRLRAGRFVDARDRADSTRVAVVGESVARRFLDWPRRSPLGRRVQLGTREDDWRTVVGVVADLRHDGLGAPPPLQAYVPYAQDFPFRVVVLLRAAGDPAGLAAPLREAIAGIDPEVPVRSVRTMEEVVGGTLLRRRLGLYLLGAFAALALVLATVGLYGLLAFTVAQRTRELGIRQALGARRTDLRRLVLRQGLQRTLAGLLVGWPAALVAGRLVRFLLFDVRPGDPMVSLVVALLLLGVALLASWLPARRAAAVEPSVVLRGE